MRSVIRIKKRVYLDGGAEDGMDDEARVGGADSVQAVAENTIHLRPLQTHVIQKLVVLVAALVDI